MDKRILATCIFTVTLACIILVVTAEPSEDSSLSRSIRAADKSKSTNGTVSGKGKGVTTGKPGSVTTGRSEKHGNTRKAFGNGQRPRAPITGKPVDTTPKPKPKPLSPLLAPRNPKHKTTTTTTEEPDDIDEEEEEEE